MTKKSFIPLPPSAHGQTPAQRLARLRLFAKMVAGKRGTMKEQSRRYMLEIEMLKNEEITR